MNKPICPVCQTTEQRIVGAQLAGATLNQVTLELQLQCTSCGHEHEGDMKYTHYYYQPTKGDYPLWKSSSQPQPQT